MEDRFSGVLIKEGSSREDDHSPLYWEDVARVFSRQFEYCEKVYYTHLSADSWILDSFPPSMADHYIGICYEEIKEALTVSHGSKSIWVEKENRNEEFFVWLT